MIKNDPTKYKKRCDFGRLRTPQVVRQPRISRSRKKAFASEMTLDGDYINFSLR